MTTRRNFLRALLALPVLAPLGCRDKRKDPPIDAPIKDWLNDWKYDSGAKAGTPMGAPRDILAQSRAFAKNFVEQNGGTRFKRPYADNLFDYLGLDRDRVRASMARGKAQVGSWKLAWGNVYTESDYRKAIARGPRYITNGKIKIDATDSPPEAIIPKGWNLKWGRI